MRIIFRLVEFGPGIDTDNPILSNEGFPLGLDAFPMLLALTLLNIVHPGSVLRGPESEFPRMSRKEKKALKKAKKEEKKQRRAEKKMSKSGHYAMTSQEEMVESGDRSQV